MYKINENVYDLNENDWFEVGKRVNKKRSFLFISKVLGKHLENNSSKILYSSMILAKRLNEVFVKSKDEFDWNLNEKDFVETYFNDTYKNSKKMVFVGFAETATGIGHSVFDRFDNSLYFHTTREEIGSRNSIISFEEEHSHATSHKCYVEEGYLDNGLPVVLVDDEVSTGNTSLNIIRDIHAKYPRKEYVVVSILNWMNEDEKKNYEIFEIENDVKIHFVYLFKGDIDRGFKEELRNSNIIETKSNNELLDYDCFSCFKEYGKEYIKETGRFGITSSEQRTWKNVLKNDINNTDENILVIGNGELIYIPIIYSYLLGDKNVKTTTRSPIFASDENSNIIKNGMKFKSLDGKDIDNYLYNIDNSYDKYIILVEKNVDDICLHDFATKLKSVVGKKVEIKYL